MKKDETYCFSDLGVTATLRGFFPEDKVAEMHAMLHIEPRGQQFPEQLARLYEGLDALKALPIAKNMKPVFMRYFLTDATNQAEYIRKEDACAVSVIQQPPLDGSKIALWIYFVGSSLIYNNVCASEEAATIVGKTTIFEHNGYKHLWNMSMRVPEGDSAFQTEKLLTAYEENLAEYGANIAENCQRTWFFVRDVDTNYAGLVKARRENFTAQGLTSDTHYIASTGIGGSPAETKALVQLDSYAVVGLEKEQVKYLYAPTHLNPTYEYGVTFERGTCINFGDRTHVYISGTASINNKGEVVHVGDISKQAERMCENVKTLLTEAEVEEENVMQVIVYLRDIADRKETEKIVSRHYPCVPIVYTLAPVCRPKWLIEMECIAVKEMKTTFNDF